MTRPKKKPEYSKFYELYAGERLEIITKLRTVETVDDRENGVTTTNDVPMIIEATLLDECETYYHFGDTEEGIINSLRKDEVVHVSISGQSRVLAKAQKPVDNSELN